MLFCLFVCFFKTLFLPYTGRKSNISGMASRS